MYRATYDASTGNVTLLEIIYIGESANVHVRIANHEKAEEWKRHLHRGEDLCFAYAPTPTTSRVRTEAALIHYHKPPVNTEYVDSFPFDETTIATTGANALLSSRFTVSRKEARTGYVLMIDHISSARPFMSKNIENAVWNFS